MAHYGANKKNNIHDTQTDKEQCCVFPKVLLLSHVGVVPLVGHQYRWDVETFTSQRIMYCVMALRL